MTAFLVADPVAACRWTPDDTIARHLPEDTRVPRRTTGRSWCVTC
jgi:hypothetical protein